MPLAIIRHTAARTTRALFLKILDRPRIGAYIRTSTYMTCRYTYEYIRVSTRIRAVYTRKLRIFVYTVSRIDFLTFSFSYITSTSYTVYVHVLVRVDIYLLVIYEYIITHLSDKWLIMFLTRTTVPIIYVLYPHILRSWR